MKKLNIPEDMTVEQMEGLMGAMKTMLKWYRFEIDDSPGCGFCNIAMLINKENDGQNIACDYCYWNIFTGKECFGHYNVYRMVENRALRNTAWCKRRVKQLSQAIPRWQKEIDKRRVQK